MFVFVGAPAWAQIRVVDAPNQVSPQTAFEVSASVGPDLQFAKVELLYRTAATGGFRAIPMTLGTDGRYRAQIPASDVAPPGVEVYVQVTGADGKSYTDPPQAPAANVFFVQAGQVAPPVKPPTVKMLEPTPDAIVLGRSPNIRVVLAPEAAPIKPGQVVANIDGIDVTAQLEILNGTIGMKPASALPPGTHQVTLTFLDASGQPLEPISWSFAVRDYELVREGTLATGLTWNSEYAPDKLRRSDPNWKASANFNVQGKVAEGALEASVDGNLRWVDQERGQVQGVRLGEMSLVNGLLSVGYGKQKFELGDLTVAGSPLVTGGAFPRRGMKFSGELLDTQFDVFGVRPEPVTGWLHVNGVNHSDNRIQGGAISRGFFGEALRLKAMIVDGETQTQSAFNTGNVVSAGSKGTTYGLQVTSQLRDGKLRGEAEWALSHADLGLNDDIGKQKDKAWRIKMNALPYEFNLGAEYQRIGRDFISLANPTMVRDRESLALTAARMFGYTSWSFGYNWSRDNVKDDHAVPRVTQKGPTATFGLVIPDFPSFTLSYLRSQQDSQYVPAGITPTEVVTDTITAGLNYTRPQWSVFFNTGYTLQDFRKGPDDTENTNFSVGLTINPSPRFSLAPTYTYNRQKNRATNTVSLTHVPTLTARVAVVPDVLILDSQTSFNEAKTEGSTSTSSLAETLRLSWFLKDLLKGYAQPALSIRFDYNQNKSGSAGVANPDGWGIFLIFDLFARAQLLPAFWLDRATTVTGTGSPTIPVGITPPPVTLQPQNPTKKP